MATVIVLNKATQVMGSASVDKRGRSDDGRWPVSLFLKVESRAVCR